MGNNITVDAKIAKRSLVVRVAHEVWVEPEFRSRNRCRREEQTGVWTFLHAAEAGALATGRLR